MSHLCAHNVSMNYVFVELISNLLTISQCQLYLSEKQNLMEKIRDVEILFLEQNENCLCLLRPLLATKVMMLKTSAWSRQ